MSRARPNYRVQDGCWNCYWCFIKSDYGAQEAFFCRRKAPKRPRCGSVYIHEEFGWRQRRRGPDKFVLRMRAWDKWARGRAVEPFGTCDAWRKRKEAGDE